MIRTRMRAIRVGYRGSFWKRGGGARWAVRRVSGTLTLRTRPLALARGRVPSTQRCLAPPLFDGDVRRGEGWDFLLRQVIQIRWLRSSACGFASARAASTGWIREHGERTTTAAAVKVVPLSPIDYSFALNALQIYQAAAAAAAAAASQLFRTFKKIVAKFCE